MKRRSASDLLIRKDGDGKMNCRRIEELLPLFVEEDLGEAAMSAVERHVQGCATCSSRLEEYGASQDWLRSGPMPEFDEAFYLDLQRSVLREMKGGRPRPSFFHKLKEGWSLNPQWAMAVLALLLVGALAFFLSARRQRGIGAPDERARELLPAPPQNRPEQKEKIPEPKERRRGHRNDLQVVKHTQKKAPVRDLRLTLPAVDPDGMKVAEAVAESRTENKVELDPFGTGEIQSAFHLDKTFEQMTRMEFQTNDPNIRIIWFAPKVSSPQSTKVDTE